MKEKVIYSGPGVFIGLSTTRTYPGKSALFYDGNKLILEVSLNTSHPTRRMNIPGIEKYQFVKYGLRMICPIEAENDIHVFVSRG